MANVSSTKNKSERSLKARESEQDQFKLAASNPFDALCDGDSGDDIVASAVAQLQATSLSKNNTATNLTNGNQKANNVNSKKNNYPQYRGAGNRRSDLFNKNNFSGKGGEDTVTVYRANNVNSRGTNSKYLQYRNRYQNDRYHGNGAKSSSSSSSGINDGSSDKAERSSVKSEREQREEEFQKKLKDFKYNPEEEEKWRKFLWKFDDIRTEKEATIRKVEALLQEQKKDEDVELIRAKIAKAVGERAKLLEDKSKALEYIRLSNNKKMTLDEFERMKEEQKKALGGPTGERRVVPASDFDDMVAVARRDLEEDGLFAKMSVHKKPEAEAYPRRKAEKTSEKKKKATLFVIGGSQSQGLNLSQKQGVGPRRQGQPLNKNGAAAVPAPDNFPLLSNSPAA